MNLRTDCLGLGMRKIYPPAYIPNRSMMAQWGLTAVMSGFLCLNVRLIPNRNINFFFLGQLGLWVGNRSREHRSKEN